MSYETVIKVQNLSKCYEIYSKPQDRLKQMVYPRIQYLLGRSRAKYYQEFWALRDISFDVKKGETIGIVGVNGSGKSTLLKLICGTLFATSGQVEAYGRVAALLELGTGFNPEFTGKENVYLNGAILGLSEEEINEKYDAILEFADIGDFIDQPVKRYSSGMYVRLAFAVIANVDADILIIDEALAVGDAIFSQKCMRFLREFKRNGTVFFVSHNSGAVVNLCDRAIWLDGGVALAIGPAKDVCEQYLASRYQSTIVDARDSCVSEMIADSDSLDGRNESGSEMKDMRMSFINQSNLRNDIQVFGFSSETKKFGSGGALISYAGLEDVEGGKLSWVVGGENVRLVIKAKLLIDCNNIIVGFNLKDKLGQVIFGQNTYLENYAVPVAARGGDTVEGVFAFRFPVLPIGTYALDIAIAEGVPPDVVQLQWLYDAFFVESQSSSVIGGLVGLPFDDISLRRVDIRECGEEQRCEAKG
ncbi:ATP-binding cassette domain-containing protein [Pseudomonas sp. Fl5BN2]|uniref:ABC transporter ATP-binding protein n=1 Tax=Pseudomonas sp. Fl5BN2 TaxID=2697652 RepID=UPI001377FF1E|nr:ABC transporter ATP-binding protein [Pseudomonas sp. Fl5BN2]NBF03407.1 ATP-binding cassette domain-containing protein [Pseudomonas sp. Fl5BN2]